MSSIFRLQFSPLQTRSMLLRSSVQYLILVFSVIFLIFQDLLSHSDFSEKIVNFVYSQNDESKSSNPENEKSKEEILNTINGLFAAIPQLQPFSTNPITPLKVPWGGIRERFYRNGIDAWLPSGPLAFLQLIHTNNAKQPHGECFPNNAPASFLRCCLDPKTANRGIERATFDCWGREKDYSIFDNGESQNDIDSENNRLNDSDPVFENKGISPWFDLHNHGLRVGSPANDGNNLFCKIASKFVLHSFFLNDIFQY